MDEKKWFLYVVDHHEGPFSIKNIGDLLGQGKATSADFVWREGMEDWVAMASLPEFAPILGKQEPSLGDSPLQRSVEKESSLAAEPLLVIDAESHGSMAQAGNASPNVDPTHSINRADIGDLSRGVDAASVSIKQLSHSDTGYCLFAQREFTGPFSFKAIVRKINSGEISMEDKLWHAGWSDLVTLSSIREVKEQAQPTKSQKKNKGGVATKRRERSFFLSPLFLFFFLIILPLSIYQFLAKGGGALLATHTPVKALAEVHLPPIPFDAAFQVVLPQLAKIPRRFAPYLGSMAGYLPHELQGYFSSIPFIEGLAPEDLKQMREVATQPMASGMNAAVIKKANTLELGFPEFYIATNAPDGTILTAQLLGKAGSLIGMPQYIKSVVMNVNHGYVLTPRFASDGNHPLAHGDYVLTVEESDEQTAEVTKTLNQAPARGSTKKVHHVEVFFVGGKKDEAYRQSLQEYNESLRQKKQSEVTEIDQILSTMIDAGKEIAEYYSMVASMEQKPKAKKRDPREAQTRQRADQAKKILEQVALKVLVPRETLEKTYVLGGVYVRSGELLGQLRRATTVHETNTVISQLGELRAQVQSE